MNRDEYDSEVHEFLTYYFDCSRLIATHRRALARAKVFGKTPIHTINAMYYTLDHLIETKRLIINAFLSYPNNLN